MADICKAAEMNAQMTTAACKVTLWCQGGGGYHQMSPSGRHTIVQHCSGNTSDRYTGWIAQVTVALDELSRDYPIDIPPLLCSNPAGLQCH